MAKDDDVTSGDVITWIFNKLDQMSERRQKRQEAQMEKEEKEREWILNAFLSMREKASKISNATHQLEHPYDAVVNNLIRVVHWLLEDARTGTTDRNRKSHEHQYIIDKLSNVAHFIGCDLVKKE
jgi:hypothetical protein